MIQHLHLLSLAARQLPVEIPLTDNTALLRTVEQALRATAELVRGAIDDIEAREEGAVQVSLLPRDASYQEYCCTFPLNDPRD